MPNQKSFVSDHNSIDHWDQLVQEFEEQDSIVTADQSIPPQLSSSGRGTLRTSGRKSTSAVVKGRKRKSRTSISLRSLSSKNSSGIGGDGGEGGEEDASSDDFQIFTDSSEDDEETGKKKKMQRKGLRNEVDDRFINQILLKRRAFANRSNTIQSEDNSSMNQSLRKQTFESFMSKFSTKSNISIESSFDDLNDEFVSKQSRKKLSKSANHSKNGQNIASSQNSEFDPSLIVESDSGPSQPPTNIDAAPVGLALCQNLLSKSVYHSTPKRTTAMVPEKETTQYSQTSPHPSQHVSQVPSPVKGVETGPHYDRDSRILLKLSKKSEKAIKKMDKKETVLLNRTLFVGDMSDPSHESHQPSFTSQLASMIKETYEERKRWLHATSSSSKNRLVDARNQSPRKTLPIRLFNMQPLRYGFVIADFVVDYTHDDENDNNFVEFRDPKILFSGRLATKMGLDNDMIMNLIEPWTKVFCEELQCDFVLNPFWIEIIQRKPIDSSSSKATRDDDPYLSIENDADTYEVVYNHPKDPS